ncbi:MAG: hypothetical protein HC819_14865 [Cyclobacteriaceae bacterium]|nr:hypothetical protein [Cyclobacteriaceae bacterium]
MAKTFILHDESVNTYGYRMLTAGADLAQFKKNPAMFFQHNDYDVPIGRWENLRVEGSKILADAVFDMDDEFARTIAGKVDRGFLKMASIGAWPLEFNDSPALMITGQQEPTITKWRLREASVVSIGANHNAVALYDEQGKIISEPQLVQLKDRIIKKPENKMKEIAIALKLADTASEQEVLVKLNELQGANATLAQEKADLEGRVKTLSDAEAARLKAEAAAMVDAAILDGRINADGKAQMLSLFDKDHTAAKSVLENMPKRVRLSGQVEGKNTQLNGREDWTYMDWAKKDAKGLNDMRLKDNAAFVALRTQYVAQV